MKAIEALEDIAQSGVLFHHIYGIDTEKNPKELANCLYVILIYNPTTTLREAVGNSATGVAKYQGILSNPEKFSSIIKELSEKIVACKNIGMIFSIPGIFEDTKKLFQQVFQFLAVKEDVVNIITTKDIVENETFIFNTLDKENYDILIDKYVSRCNLIKVIHETEFNINSASLYLSIFLSIKEKECPFTRYIVKGLIGVSKEKWKEEEENADNTYGLFNLLVELSKNKIEIGLQTEFSDYLETYLESPMEIDFINSEWSNLLNALNESHRDTLLSNNRDKLINKNENFSKILNLFGIDLIECKILQRKSDDLVRAFIHFIDRKDETELKWMNEVIKKCIDITKKCEKHSLNSFKDKIKNELENEDLEENKKSALSETAKLLEIEWKPKEQEKLEEEDKTE